MSEKQPFAPKYGSGQVLTAGAAPLSTAVDADNKQVRIINTGAAIAFVRAYSSKDAPTPIATIADMPCPPLPAVTTITMSMLQDRLAYISPTGTTLQIITGEGW